MPKPTFFALPDEKRARVAAAAVHEFGVHPYGAASLDRIATRAGVSKGSLYQYFVDKADLYEWLVTTWLPARKAEAHARHADDDGDDGNDLFGWLGRGLAAGLRLFRDDADLAALAARVAMPASDLEADRVHRAVRALTHAGLCGLVARARAAGQVRDDVHDDFAAEAIASLVGTAWLATLARRLGTDLEALLMDPQRAATAHPSLTRALATEAIGALRRAIGVAPAVQPDAGLLAR